MVHGWLIWHLATIDLYIAGFTRDKDRVQDLPLGDHSTVFQAEVFAILKVPTKEEVKVATNRRFASIKIAKLQ